MLSTFKPMLAPGEDPKSFPDYFKKLRYPLLVSPKLDGIRCVIRNHVAMSRSFKMLPSMQVQKAFCEIDYLDGELIEGNMCDFDVYNRTQSYVMSYDKIGDMSYHVFDYCHPDWLHKPFYERLEEVNRLRLGNDVVPHEVVEDYDSLIEIENMYLAQGFEGIMMRDPVGRYKCGRGTFNEGLIYKLKRFSDGEGIIVSVYEAKHNNNIAVKDALGYTERSTKKDGMIPSGMLGGFVISFEDQFLDVAPGAFTHVQRKELFEEQPIGKILKFRFMRHGSKDKPRFPRAVGLRDIMDLI